MNVFDWVITGIVILGVFGFVALSLFAHGMSDTYNLNNKDKDE